MEAFDGSGRIEVAAGGCLSSVSASERGACVVRAVQRLREDRPQAFTVQCAGHTLR
jgi:hypothetical protein